MTTVIELIDRARTKRANGLPYDREMAQLVRSVDSRKITRYALPDNDYEDYLQDNWLWFIANVLDSYDPTRSNLTTWFNRYLDYRIRRDRTNTYRQSLLQRKIIQHLEYQAFCNDDYRAVALEFDDFYAYLSGVKVVTSSTGVSLQALVNDRLEGMRWTEISKKYDAPIATLSAFYARSLKRLSAGFSGS